MQRGGRYPLSKPTSIRISNLGQNSKNSVLGSVSGVGNDDDPVQPQPQNHPPTRCSDKKRKNHEIMDSQTFTLVLLDFLLERHSRTQETQIDFTHSVCRVSPGFYAVDIWRLVISTYIKL